MSKGRLVGSRDWIWKREKPQEREGGEVPKLKAQVQAQDRHEHGGLPETEQIETLGTRGLIEGWEFWPSATGALADITVDEHGHVTVTCHCAKCEAYRRLDQYVESLVGGAEAPDYYEEMERLKAERAKNDEEEEL